MCREGTWFLLLLFRNCGVLLFGRWCKKNGQINGAKTRGGLLVCPFTQCSASFVWVHPMMDSNAISGTVAEVGMPVSNHKASAREQQESERRLRTLVTGDNAICADCRMPIQFRNAWACINLGTYICIQCSGVHRSLGVHISKVRAVDADDWNSDWVDNMERWGNTRATAFWESKPPLQRPEAVQDATSASRGMVDFIRVREHASSRARPGLPSSSSPLVPPYLAAPLFSHEGPRAVPNAPTTLACGMFLLCAGQVCRARLCG